MNKRKAKELNNMKKKINELFLLGGISECEMQAMTTMDTSSEIAFPSTSNSNDAVCDAHTKPDAGEISRRLAVARQKKLPGPQLTLTLERLGGVLLGPEEIRDLVQFSLLGPIVTKPKWAYFRPWKSTSQTVVIRVNCTSEMIVGDDCVYPYISNFFNKAWIKMDKGMNDRSAFWRFMLNVPVTLQEQIREKVMKMEETASSSESLRLELLVTQPEMVEFSYPFPDGCIQSTREKYAALNGKSPLFALDCEMCITTANKHELTRISLINEEGRVLFDTLVKPVNEITDYLTKFSGITRQMLDGVTVTLHDVQKAMRACLPPDAILVGHSLEFDLKAIGLAHPYCIDVSLIYNMSGSRTRTSLKSLLSTFLDQDIQGTMGHCSVEDAVAALNLVRLKLDKGMVFGNCRYGWNYDEWVRAKRKCVATGEPSEKKIRTEPVKKPERLCACGFMLGLECIVEGCHCQKLPPTDCVLCLGKKEVAWKHELLFDWSDSLRIDVDVKTRPLGYYLIDSRKTVMVAVDEAQVEANRVITVRKPTDYESPSALSAECAADLLNYGLALVELDYTQGEQHIKTINNVLEEGECANTIISKDIDSSVEKIIKSAARYGLVCLIFSSPEQSICYLKVKQ